MGHQITKCLDSEFHFLLFGAWRSTLLAFRIAKRLTPSSGDEDDLAANAPRRQQLVAFGNL